MEGTRLAGREGQLADKVPEDKEIGKAEDAASSSFK
jgi:hypothetical protein